jgi:hypothetical protein
MVRTALQELIKQIAIRPVKLNTIKAGILRVRGAQFVVPNDARNFGNIQSARRLKLLLRANQAYVSRSGNALGANRQLAVQKDGVGDAPHMPDLRENPPTGLMHSVRNASSTFPLADRSRCREPARSQRLAD